MLFGKISCILIVMMFAWARAGPVHPVENEVEVEVSRDGKSADIYEVIKKARREGRQGYSPYYGVASYDYHPVPDYPVYYASDFYQPAFPVPPPPPPHRPSYYGGVQNNLQAGYSHDYRKTHQKRRRFRPNDRIEATSQKYTVWDLSRK